jgi:hypothetical protein
MTELVSHLERHDCVYRTRDPSDGRAWIIWFTERGLAIDRVARRALRGTEREWAKALGQDAYLQLLRLLERRLPVAEGAHGSGSFADLSDHRPVSPEEVSPRGDRRPPDPFQPVGGGAV